MTKRDWVIILPLLGLAFLCYLVGYREAYRIQKKRDTEFNIRRSLRILHEAQAGDMAKITNECRMYLLGHVKVYEDLVSESGISDSFRSSFAEARQIARDVQTNLVVLNPKVLGQ
jgi:hypothetical protein